MAMFSEIVMIDYGRSIAKRKESRKFCGPYRWRPNSKPGNGIGFYMASNGLAMDEHGSPLRLRLEMVGGSRYYGRPSEYAFNEFGGSYRPIIARLPSGRGFLAGATMGEGMSSFLDGFVYQEEEEARYAAHEEARIAALGQEEFEQEENERFAEEEGI